MIFWRSTSPLTIRLAPRIGVTGLLGFVLFSLAALWMRIHIEHLSVALVLEQVKVELESSDLLEYPDQLDRLSSSLHEKGYDLLLQQPSGIWIPEERLAALAQPFFLEATTQGSLSGGKVRLIYSTSLGWFFLVLAATGSVVLLATMRSRRSAQNFETQTYKVTQILDRLAQDRSPTLPESWCYSEISELGVRGQRIVDRALEQSLTSFVKTESLHDLQSVRGELLASVSHDLRAPLGATIGLLELLLEDSAFSAEQHQHLTALEQRSHRLLKRLNEVLDTAKFEQGKFELFIEEAMIPDLVRQAIQQAERGRDAKEIPEIEIALEPGLSPVKLDPLRVTLALAYALDTLFDDAEQLPTIHRSNRISIRIFRTPRRGLGAHNAPAGGDLAPARWLVVEIGGYAGAKAEGISDRTMPSEINSILTQTSMGWALALQLSKKLVALCGGHFEEQWEPGSPWDSHSRYRKLTLWLVEVV